MSSMVLNTHRPSCWALFDMKTEMMITFLIFESYFLIHFFF